MVGCDIVVLTCTIKQKLNTKILIICCLVYLGILSTRLGSARALILDGYIMRVAAIGSRVVDLETKYEHKI